ncbi:MAG: hypothetical protein JWN75_805 [Candidatus Saccharibacteria bacterium]|nr:hypothetical protein [Candidatus Saccharibacteria bacterium]
MDIITATMKKNNLKLILNKKLFIAIIVFLIIVRIVIGFNLHYWLYSGAVYDDGWMVSSSVLTDHFSVNDEYSLIKDMAYPVLLFLNGLSGIPYSLSLALLWVLVAITGMLLARKFTSNRIALLAVFAFLLFFPSAFEANIGTKIYRNSIIIPMIFMLIFALLHLVFAIIIDRYRNKKYIFGWAFALGILLLINFYIKENGLWILLLVGAVLLSLAIYILLCEIRVTLKERGVSQIAQLSQRKITQVIKKIDWNRIGILLLILLLPIIIFEAGTLAYKNANQRHFGVSAINTRTEGAFGEFIDTVYSIKANGRSDVVWAPWDAIRIAFAASPTLQSMPELEQNISNSPWVPKGVVNSGMIHDGMIGGDFFTWVLRDAYLKSNNGKWNDKDMESFFSQVNKELSDAISHGSLEDAGLIQITSSMGGYTPSQMIGVSDIVLSGLKNDLFFYGYRYDAALGDNCADKKVCDIASKTLNIHIKKNGSKLGVFSRLVNAIISLYRIINPLLIILAVTGIITEVVFIIRRQSSRKNSVAALSAIILLFGGVALIFAIAWFVNFIYYDNYGFGSAILYYAIEATPLLITAELFGLYLFFNRVPKTVKWLMNFRK